MKKAMAMTAMVAEGYEAWIRSIKERIQRARVKASMLVDSEQTLLYWDIGHDILETQDKEGWGAKVVERMSTDLKKAFPDMTGWSPRNLKYMRALADAWKRTAIVQAPLAQLQWNCWNSLEASTTSRKTCGGRDEGVLFCHVKTKKKSRCEHRRGRCPAAIVQI